MADPDRALRVALLTPCFWPEVRRGGERLARDLADGLLARGHRPRLITSHQGRPRRTVEDGLRILRLPRPPDGPLRHRFDPYLSHVPLTYAALRIGDYDVAHAVSPQDALAAARWGKRTGHPAILTYLGVPVREWLAERRRLPILRSAMKGCDAVVALSRHAQEAFARVLGFEAPVIEPGVDLHTFAPGAAKTSTPTIVCAAAAEEPRKHVGLLVDALQLVRRQQPRARLWLSRPKDLRRATAAGVAVNAPGVEWVELDDRTALAGAYGAAWVAALPASYEAFGLVLLEALACGTPVVGYDDGGIPEIIDRPGIGHLFDRLDARTLADSLLEGLSLSQDPSTAGRCRRRAEELSLDRSTERYIELYRSLETR
jgi:glycosyltransferase involved in cell wall biosynthesis